MQDAYQTRWQRPRPPEDALYVRRLSLGILLAADDGCVPGGGAPGRASGSDVSCSTIEAERITTVHFVPSMLEAFLEVPGLERLQSVRRVICGGEALGLDVQTRFFERLATERGATRTCTGPTEASVDVTFWQCARKNRYPFVPIGSPIANTQIYVLDRHMNPTPIGVPGELHIGGIGVARGYLGQDALTAERFVPDVISSKPGARLYKTGDLARFNCGRRPRVPGTARHQVKIRGLPDRARRDRSGDSRSSRACGKLLYRPVRIRAGRQAPRRLRCHRGCEGRRAGAARARSAQAASFPSTWCRRRS